MKRRLVRWFYMRRAQRLKEVAGYLGWDEAIRYGDRRGWIERVDASGNVHLKRGRV